MSDNKLMDQNVKEILKKYLKQTDPEKINIELNTTISRGIIELLAMSDEFIEEILPQISLEKEIMEINEKERNEVGNELNEELGQDIAAVAMKIKVLENKLKKKKIGEAEDLKRINENIKETIKKIRDLSEKMCPVNDTQDGLKLALEQLVSKTNKLNGVKCNFKYAIPTYFTDKVFSSYIYHIFNGVIADAIQDREVKNIEGSIKWNNNLVMIMISDDGKKFEIYGDKLKKVKMRVQILDGNIDASQALNGRNVVAYRIPLSG